MKIRLFVRTAPAVAMLVLSAATPVLAQQNTAATDSFPSRPIRLVVPFAPGGSSDTITRVIGPHLAEQMGQQVVLDNRSGGNGALGTQIIARAMPDGYTIGLAYIATLATNPAISGDVGYDPLKDFSAITQLTASANVLAVHPSVAAGSVKELVSLAKTKPGQLNYSSGGVGTIGHLSAELLQQAAGIKLNHIAYKGSGQAVVDLVGGHVGIMFGGMSAVAGHAKAGKLKLLAVTGKQRMPIAPEIPTIAESGYPDFEAVGWFGLIAPAKTPKAIISRLNAEAIKAANSADANKRLTAIGFDIVTTTPEAFALYTRNEFIKWRQLAQKLGLKAE